MADGVIPLAADFPPADHAAWLAQAVRALGDTPAPQTPGGLSIQPLYTAEDALPPAPGRLETAWDVRTRIDHPSPAQANRHALQDLENGASSLLVSLDPTGQAGVAAASEDDLARTLDGVLLDVAPVALDAGFLAPAACDWLARLAKAAPQAPLAFHLDPLSAFAAAGVSPGPMEGHLSAAALAAHRHRAAYPRASLFLASGVAVHEAGGSEAQELGFAAAAALTYARALSHDGLAPSEAFPRIVLGLAADAEYIVAIAKLKAARILWARITAACGAEGPARIEARSSRRMLTARDAHVNLARLTAAGFAAAVGGADAMVLDPFTQPLGAAADQARRLARNLQLILLEESDLARVADPAAGAWAVESLADRIARDAWAFLQAIEAEGGALDALRSGLVARAVEQARDRRAAGVAAGRAPIVGVTVFADPAGEQAAVAARDPAAFAKPSPSASLPGPDNRCPPIRPWRAAQTHEAL